MQSSNKPIHPEIIKRFEIVQMLGEGKFTVGMRKQVVWKAIHKSKRILCAIKKCIDPFQTKATAQRVVYLYVRCTERLRLYLSFRDTQTSCLSMR